MHYKIYCRNCGTQWRLSKEAKESIECSLRIILCILKKEDIPVDEENAYPLVFFDRVIACCDKPNIYWKV